MPGAYPTMIVRRVARGGWGYSYPGPITERKGKILFRIYNKAIPLLA